MTSFSDCYVLSETVPAWHVVAAVQALGSRFLRDGILTRGTVVAGPAYHNGRVLFGPGILDAYKLESGVAFCPRILVSEEVRKAVWGYHEGLWEGRLLKRDHDGWWFVNLLVPSFSSWKLLSDPNSPHDVRSHLEQVRRGINHRSGPGCSAGSVALGSGTCSLRSRTCRASIPCGRARKQAGGARVGNRMGKTLARSRCG
jgi:hypothetical protein